MKPPDYSRSLYFTPRTPWGRRPQKRPGLSPNYSRQCPPRLRLHLMIQDRFLTETLCAGLETLLRR